MLELQEQKTGLSVAIDDNDDELEVDIDEDTRKKAASIRPERQSMILVTHRRMGTVGVAQRLKGKDYLSLTPKSQEAFHQKTRSAIYAIKAVRPDLRAKLPGLVEESIAEENRIKGREKTYIQALKQEEAQLAEKARNREAAQLEKAFTAQLLKSRQQHQKNQSMSKTRARAYQVR